MVILCRKQIADSNDRMFQCRWIICRQKVLVVFVEEVAVLVTATSVAAMVSWKA